MQISLLCVGKLKDTFYREACGEYEKRLSRYHKLSITEVPDEGTQDDRPISIQKALEKEAARLLPHLEKGYPVALTIDGNAGDSHAFARRMAGYQHLGQPLVLIIGGSHGLHESVLARCKERISLSPLTFPHNLVRLIVLEQLYRAAKIDAGEPYHK